MTDPQKLSCWILTDGKIGMVNQCRGLALALDVPAETKTVDLRAPWSWLPPALTPTRMGVVTAGSDPLGPPWPDLLIASGRRSVAPARAVRRASKGRTFCIQIQDPGIAPSAFDLVVAPEHDGIAGPNVVTTLGACHGVTPDSLAAARTAFAGRVAHLPHPLAAVLIGGDNAVYTMTEAVGAALAAELRTLAQNGWSLAITPSRRTPAHARAAIASALAGLPVDIWDETGANPYLGYLAHADAIVVTCDSVNMVSEAAATGKPVHIVHLEGGSDKFWRFHAAMEAAGITRRFTGAGETWTYTPPGDMARIAHEVMRRLAARARV
jgi:mitochondrial fission protein ELM1